MVPTTLLLRITTFAARRRRSQVTSLESMMRCAAGVLLVIVHGPVYLVSLVPFGTPVLSGPGQHPPAPSGPPATCGFVLLHAPRAGALLLLADGETLGPALCVAATAGGSPLPPRDD